MRGEKVKRRRIGLLLPLVGVLEVLELQSKRLVQRYKEGDMA